MKIKEKLITISFFTGIFLPARLLFYTYVSQYWLGSFGLISGIMITLMYFSNKGRLGKVGEIVNRQVSQYTKGKFGLLTMFMLLFFIYIFSLTIYGINNTPVETKNQMNGVLAGAGVTDLASLQTSNLRWTGPGEEFGMLWSLVIVLTPNNLAYALYSIMNDMTNGWILHFVTVFLIEDVEAFGLLCYFRYFKTQTVM